MLDALCFALYGKPFRKITLPLLINSVNNKNLRVEVELSVGRNSYRIVRGLKPKVFEIHKNGELLPQDGKAADYQNDFERNVLKMDHRSFGQIVVLGSASFKPFMQLSTPDRRLIIEDILDIQVFSKMNSLLKDRASLTRKELAEIGTDLRVAKDALDRAKKHNAEIRDMKTVQSDKLVSKIADLEEEITKLEAENEKIHAEGDELKETITDLGKVNEKKTKIGEYRTKYRVNKTRIEKEIEFFRDNENCPTCKQEIEIQFKTESLKKREDKIVEIENAFAKLDEHLSRVEARLGEISDVQNKISELQTAYGKNLTSIQIRQRTIRETQRELTESEKDVVAIDQSEVEELAKKFNEISKVKETLDAEDEKLKVVANLLKDGGIKAKLIKQYIPQINQLCNEYLTAMDFHVQFELDENFNETIKSRGRDTFTYFSFSEGEKLRIDLALLFTWRAISKLRNSVSTNIMFMDEILDSSLDDQGTDDFLNIIRNLTKDTKIFIISHKGEDYQDKFDSVIKMDKKKGFSVLTRD
jgi:DNA repair exonuclease SbcCD ATPase subunit